MRTDDDWAWPVVIGETRNYIDLDSLVVSAYEAAEDKADDRDYRFFLAFVYLGAFVYISFFVLGVWKGYELVRGLV